MTAYVVDSTVQLGAPFVTADDRLANALVATSWAGNILRLRDVA